MLAFEVLINGKRLCIAGTGTSDVLSTVVSWARRAQDRGQDKLDFHIGGIVAGNSNEHFGWTTPALAIGDEITIRLVDADTWDKPEHVYQPARNPQAEK